MSAWSFQSRFFLADHPSPTTSRMVAMAWKWGLSPSRWWQFQSTTMPMATRPWTQRRARAILSSRGSSTGRAMSNSRASWASFRFSAASMEFHSRCRFSIHSGAWAGRLTSLWSMPSFRV